MDDFVREFEEFIGSIYEKCFLAGESLQRGLRDCCGVCLEFAGNVVEKLEGNEEGKIGRRKVEVSVDGEKEETTEGATRAAMRADAVMGVLEGTEWTEMVTMLEGRFQERRNEFLETLEKQPGFLQSSFLALHRKLRLRFRWVVCYEEGSVVIHKRHCYQIEGISIRSEYEVPPSLDNSRLSIRTKRRLIQ